MGGGGGGIVHALAMPNTAFHRGGGEGGLERNSRNKPKSMYQFWHICFQSVTIPTPQHVYVKMIHVTH